MNNEVEMDCTCIKCEKEFKFWFDPVNEDAPPFCDDCHFEAIQDEAWNEP